MATDPPLTEDAIPTQYYLAIAERAPGEAAWSITYREFPEVCASAANATTLPIQARDALLTVIDAYREDHRPLPTPLPDPPSEAVEAGWERVLLMLAAEIPTISVRINVSIDQTLLSRIDAAAPRLGMTRSALLAEGARRMIEAGVP
jgi:predicted RNase H-like HicB family nuclease